MSLVPGTDRTDAEIMADDSDWPNFYLPVKKKTWEGPWRPVGVMRPGESTVYLINLFEVGYDTDWGGLSGYVYPDYAAVVADGWIVD